jgi:hypothetical protein
MRVSTTALFDKFLINNGQLFPYSRLRATRNSFYCKWIMQKGYSELGLTYYFPTMANSLPGSLLHAISIDGANPIPPELTGIMEDMFWWGKTQSYVWYERVVNSIGLLLDNAEEVEMKLFVRELIAFRVAVVLKKYFAVDSLIYTLLFDKYWCWFSKTYSEMDFFHGRNCSFRGMAEASFQYVEWCIARINYNRNVPLTLVNVEHLNSA